MTQYVFILYDHHDHEKNMYLVFFFSFFFLKDGYGYQLK